MHIAEGRPKVLRNDHPLLSQIVEAMAQAVILLDRTRTVAYANDAAVKMFGVPRSELVGRSWENRPWQAALLDGSPVPPDQVPDQRALEAGEASGELERWVTRQDGTQVALSGNVVPLRGESGEVVAAVISFTDITDRVRAERELRQRKAYYRAIAENSTDAVVLFDGNARITHATPNATRIIGYALEDLVGRQGFDLIHPDDQMQARNDHSICMAEPGKSRRSTLRTLCRNGEYKLLEVTVRDRRGEPAVGAIVANFRDVTAQEEAVNAVRASEARYRELFERNLAGVFRSRMDGTLLDCNDAFTRIFGFATRAEMSGRNTHEFDRSQEDRHKFATALLEQGSLTNYESPMIRQDGSPIWILENVSVRYEGGELVQEGTVIDITDRKRIEEQLRQAHKMEAIGQLAGGIAHDFNNLLTAILGNISIAAMKLPSDSAVRPLLEESEKAGWRAAELTSQLLGFARRSAVRMEPLSLSRVVAETIGLLRRTIDPRVVIAIQTAPDLGPVLADAAQMHQLVFNLCLNSRDAMPEGGRLTVETANAPVVVDGAVHHVDARPGSYVRLSVMDTGQGMSEDVRARMFEPFFTTKEVGKGTGLGLAMVFAVVKRHGGWIDCTSSPSNGTRFDVYLPMAAREPDAPEVSEPIVRGGTETILLADDEPLIRALGQMILKHHGYTILLAKDGAEAVELFRRERDAIQLILLDMTMPKLSGKEVLAEIRKLDPAAKVILSSGYSAENLTTEEVAGLAGFVNKPYKPKDLALAVRTALDR